MSGRPITRGGAVTLWCGSGRVSRRVLGAGWVGRLGKGSHHVVDDAFGDRQPEDVCAPVENAWIEVHFGGNPSFGEAAAVLEVFIPELVELVGGDEGGWQIGQVLGRAGAA